MARNVVLGNSGLTVGINEQGLVHDFYFPYVGLENLTTARMNPHHIGIWVDGEFSWLSDGNWNGDVNFEDTALVSSISVKNDSLGVSLKFKDFVDSSFDALIRKITIENLKDTDREIRMFFHQNFQISAMGRADTAMYVPEGHYILDYKGKCAILAYAENSNGEAFDQYAAGSAGIEGKEGTFRDAEDGELSMSAVEHGGVDSTIRVKTVVAANSKSEINYWLIVSDSQDKLEKTHEHLLKQGLDHRLAATRQHWHDWLSVSDSRTIKLSPSYRSALRKSLMTIKVHADKRGGIIASCDSSIYNYGRDYYSYVWPRDGAYAIWPLIKLGYTHEAKEFFRFCRSILTEGGYLMHKYQPDKAIGSTWHPLIHGRRKELAIQEDETAIVVFMLSEYLRYSNDKEFVMSEMYEDFIKPTANFMSDFIDRDSRLPHASYDLWEEKFLSSTYSTAIVARSLVRASEIASMCNDEEESARWLSVAESLSKHSEKYFDENSEHLVKGFLLNGQDYKIDNKLDVSSFYGCWMYDYGSVEHIQKTIKKIEEVLLDKSPSGGVPRYEDDGYFRSDPAYKGNPWFVTTLWLAQYYASIGESDKTKQYIDWTLKHSTESGLLSEQVNPETGFIISVTPLVWSHAELINTLLVLK